MMTLFLTLILLFVGSIALYYLIIHLIKRWTGCDNTEAEQKLHNFVNGKTPYSFKNDVAFQNDVEYNIQNIIGDKRFNQLCRLSQIVPLLAFNYNSGLPYIAITVNYADDNEKRIIERVLVKLVQRYLQIHSCNTRVLTDWRTNKELSMPCLEIRYATNKEENRIMDNVLRSEQSNIILQNSAITDDEDENDLDE